MPESANHFYTTAIVCLPHHLLTKATHISLAGIQHLACSRGPNFELKVLLQCQINTHSWLHYTVSMYQSQYH